MSNYNSLKTTIDANIKQNGNQEITGQILNSVLNQMVTTLGAGYQYAGVATTATNPGTPDAKVFYIANGKGKYTNFGGLEVTEDEVVVLYWDTAWHKEATGIASQAKLTELGQKLADYTGKITITGNNVSLSQGVIINIDGTRSTLKAPADASFTLAAVRFLIAYDSINNVCLVHPIQTSDPISNGVIPLAFFEMSSFDYGDYYTISNVVSRCEIVINNEEALGNGIDNYLSNLGIIRWQRIVNRASTKFIFFPLVLAEGEQFRIRLSVGTNARVWLQNTQGTTPEARLQTIEGVGAAIIDKDVICNVSGGTSYIAVAVGGSSSLNSLNVSIYRSSYNDGREALLNIKNNESYSYSLAANAGTKFFYKEINLGYNRSCHLKFSSTGGGVRFFLQNVADSNVIYRLQAVVNPEQTNGDLYFVCNVPDGAIYLMAAVSSYSTEFSVSVELEQGLLIDTKAPNQLQEIDCELPNYILGIDAAGNYGRNYVQTIFPESVLSSKVPVDFDGMRYFLLQTLTKTGSGVETANFTGKLCGVGYKDKQFTIPLVIMKPSTAFNKNLRYLAIGDSISDADVLDLDGSTPEGWNYQSFLKVLSMQDNIDAKPSNSINILMVGTRNIKENAPQLHYNGVTEDIRVRSEGRASWCAATYLRHPELTIVSGGSGISSSHPFDKKAAWDAMGLGRKIRLTETYDEAAPYTNWENTSANINLMRTTCWGYYHWDYSEELWTALKSTNPNGIFDGAGSYTGSTSDKALIDAGMNFILEHPSNPFFDKDKALYSSANAFSMIRYINAFKTLDNDGITRLVVGSTAGTEVTNDNINIYDVCVPSHISIALGQNDFSWFNGTSAQAIFDDIIEMAETINAEYPSIKVGIAFPRHNGVFYPHKWDDVAVCMDYDIETTTGKGKYDLNKLAQTYFGDISEQSQNYYIPIFYVQSPLTGAISANYDNLSLNTKVVKSGSDSVHPGILGHRTIGLEILAWIYYCA